MDRGRDRAGKPGGSIDTETTAAPSPGKATRVAVQRKAAPGPDRAAMDPGAVHTAAAQGVDGATGALPHLDSIQRSFGRHDVSGVNAQVGGDAAVAAGQIGAQAYAVGDRIAFAQQPDVHTAAHEAAHVVQQRAGVAIPGGVGSEGDPYERHADRVADAVVAGQSAEALLDEMEAGAGESTAVQRKPGDMIVVNAEMYLHLNARSAADAIKQHLGSVPLPSLHPRLAWNNPGEFRKHLYARFDTLLFNLGTPSELRQVLRPANPYTIVDQVRPILGIAKADPGNPMTGGPAGPADWRYPVGRALGQLFEAAVVASLKRMGPRWLASADELARGSGSGASAAGNTYFIDYSGMVLSHHMDRAVAWAMCNTPSVFDIKPEPKDKAKGKGKGDEAAAGDAQPAPPTRLKPVTFKWMGSRDRALWNWVRVDQPDATAEDVAAAMFEYTKAGYGEENTSFLAHGITAAPPLFGIPASWARNIPDAREYAPMLSAPAEDHSHSHLLALAGSSVGDEQALREAAAQPDANAAPSVTQAEVGALIADSTTQAQYLRSTLVSWNLAAPIDRTLGFLGRTLFDATTSPAGAAKWAPVLKAQKQNLSKVGGAVTQLDRGAKSLGVEKKTGPEGEALRDILVVYAEAAATSHLASTSRGLIAKAAEEQGKLSMHSVEGSVRGMDAAMDMMRDSVPHDDTRKNFVDSQALLDQQALELQSRMLAGDKVDADEVDKLTLRTDTLALRARVHAITTQLDVLEHAARDGNDSVAENFAALFSSDFADLESAAGMLRWEVAQVVEAMDQASDNVSLGWDHSYGKPEEYDRAMHETKRKALASAQARFAEIAEKTNIGKFLKEGAELVKWQAFRTACVKVAALIGVSLIGGALGGVLARSVGGVLLRAGGSQVLADLGGGAVGLTADSAIAGAGQAAIFGDDFSDAFLENILTGLGSSGVLKVLAKNADEIHKVEVATRGLWQKLGAGGKVVLRETAAIGGHAIMGAALGYVAHKIVTGKTQPPPATLEEWLLQGASIAVGRYVGKGLEGRLAGYKKLGGIPGFDPGKRLHTIALELDAMARGLEVKPDSPTALELMSRRHELLLEEVDALDGLIARPETLKQAKIPLHEVVAMKRELLGWLDGVHAAGLAEIPFHLAGLEELVPGAVWKGTRAEIETAVRSAERQGADVKASRDDATGRWRVELEGKTMELHERAPVEDAASAAGPRAGRVAEPMSAADAAAAYKPVTLEADHAHGERAISSDLVPGSTFKGKAVDHGGDFAAEKAYAGDLMVEVGHKLPNLTGNVPGVKQIQHAGGNRYVVTMETAKGTVHSTVEVIVGPLPDQVVARSVVNSTKQGKTKVDGHDVDIHGRHVIELSVNADKGQVERAVAGQLASIVSAQQANHGGSHAPKGTLHADHQPGALGPNDLGRIAELNVLASQRAKSMDPAQTAAIDREIAALVEHLGLRKGTDGAEERMDALRPHLRGPAETALDESRRGMLEGTDAEQTARKQMVKEIEDAAWKDLSDLHRTATDPNVHALPPSLAPPGQKADLGRIQDAARMAARLREMVSERTLAGYREQIRSAKPGETVSIADVQLGGGAALAARRPGALLVDNRGRWQADGGTHIAQTAQQLDGLREAGFGDPREVAGPDGRVPIEAIRYWEDSIASQGPVINGTASFRTADDGTLVVDIKPADGSTPLTLKVNGTPTIATGFPTERPPGSPFGITIADSILHLEGRLKDIVKDGSAPPDVIANAKRALAALQKLEGGDILNGSFADRILGVANDDPASAALRHAIDDGTPMTKDALQAVGASEHWINLKNNDVGGNHLFLGDEANLASIGDAAVAKNAPKNWVVAGAGGTSISAVEIILAKTKNADPPVTVTMLGKGTPAGLVENDQFRKVAAEHLDKASGRKLGIEVNDDTTGRLKIVIDEKMQLGLPQAKKDSSGNQSYEAGKDSQGNAYSGDGYVSAMGRENQVPPMVSAMVMQARREGREVVYDPHYVDGQYVGYAIRIKRKDGAYDVFDVTGAVSRFVPRAQAPRGDGDSWKPSRDSSGLSIEETEKLSRASDMDAPAASGNFDAGFVATAVQAWRYAMDRAAKKTP